MVNLDANDDGSGVFPDDMLLLAVEKTIDVDDNKSVEHLREVLGGGEGTDKTIGVL